jgi:hypothetical protein
MMRWIDVMGFAGLAMVVLGTLLLFPSSAEHMNWGYELAGMTLWFAGVASVVGWLLLRWSIRPRRSLQQRPTGITPKPANESRARQAS